MIQDLTIFSIDDDAVPLAGYGVVSARSNKILWSRDLTNAVHTGTGTRTFDQIGLTGAPNTATLLSDTSAAASQSRSQAVTIPNDSNPVVASWWIRKDTDQTRFPSFLLNLTGGTTAKGQGVVVDTSTGATVLVAAVGGGGTVRVTDKGFWWLIEIVVTNNTTGNVTATVQTFPARRATLAGANVATAVGGIIIGQLQLELNRLFASDPIVTGAAAVTIIDEVTEATFSTDPTHPRPYLKFNKDLGESVIDFLAGGSLIGETALEIVDFPRIAGDQDSGILTYLAASAAGDSGLLGVRMLWRQQRDDGTWENVFDGMCGDISMPKLSTFKLTMRDPREREREAKAFNTATNTCIFPRVGPREGYGYRAEYDATNGYALTGDPVMPRIAGAQALFKAATSFDNGTLLGALAGGAVLSPRVYLDTDEYAELLKKWGQVSVIGEPSFSTGYTFPAPDPDTGQEAYVATAFDAAVEWSPSGLPGTYTRLSKMPMGGLLAPINVFDIRTDEHGKKYVRAIVMNVPADLSASLPADNQVIWVRVVSDRPPTEDVPLYIEESFGALVRHLYDGFYTKQGTMIPVRYDDTQMSIMQRTTEIARARITEVADNMREWVQEHAYRPAGWAPAIRNGLVYPIKYEIPNENALLAQLDNSNVIRAEWLHGTDHIVNQVVVEYEREIVPTTLTQFAKPTVQKVIIERNRLTENSTLRHGTKPQTFKPVTLRSIVSESESSQAAPASEVGALISARRGEELLRRFTNGAQVVNTLCRRTAAVENLREGDWVIMAVSWLPDYITRRRGINRLMQVMKLGRADPHRRSFLLLDAGPYDVPIGQPTLGAISEQTNPVRVAIPVTAIPAGGRAEVQYAFGETQPEVDSGLWLSAGYTDVTQTVYTLPFPRPGALIWVRARGTADGRRASAWTNPVSLRLSSRSLLRGAEVTIETDTNSANYGKPIVTWEPLTGTVGVRINYELHAIGTDPPGALTQHVDVAASALSAVLPVTLAQFQQITVQVVGYPGFAGGVVTGTAGLLSQYRTASRFENTFILPTVTEDRSQDSTTGTLVVTITDPQGRVTKVEFRTRAGDTGAWSAWAQDSTIPYGTTVALVGNETSLIEYRITGYDVNGVLVTLWQAQVAYNSALVGFTEVVITQTATTASQVTYQVTTRGGAGAGTGTVQLVSLSGSASLASGASVGTPVASGSSWTFNRGTPASTDGAAADALATFRAIQTGYQTDDDMVVIPPRGVDTRSLSVRATVQSTTASQIVVRVAVADPVAQSGQDVSIAYVATGTGTVTPASPQTILSANVTADLATTGFIDFTITRPAFQAGTGRIVFTATRTNRTADLDAVDVPAQERDTQSLEVRIERVSETGTQIVVRVKAIRPNVTGAISIAYDAGGLTVSPASPQSIVSATSDFSTTGFVDFTITKNATQPRRVAFTASATGYTDATDGVDVVPATASGSGVPTGTVTPNTTSRTRATEVLDIAGTLGSNDAGPLQWRYKIDDGAYSALGTTTPISITRGIFWHRHVQVEFSQADGQKVVVPFTVLSALEPLDDVTGRYKRSVPMTDGNYPVVSTSSDGLTAHANLVESGLKFINRMFAKPLSSSSDNADSVGAGTSFRIPLLGGTDGSGNINFAGSAWVNRYATSLARSSGDATTVQTIVQNISNLGHAAAAMQESGGKFINKMFAKPLSSSADTADSVAAGSSFRIPLLGGTDSSGNIDMSGSAWVNKNTNNLTWKNATPTGGTWTASGLTFNTGQSAATTINDDFTTAKFHTDTAVPGAELKVVYGSAVIFDQLRLYMQGTSAANFTIEYWNGSSWISLKTNVIPKTPGWNVFTFGRTSATQFRIRLTNTPGAGPWCNQVEWVDSVNPLIGMQTLVSESSYVFERAINLIKRQSFSFRDVALISDDVTPANTMYAKSSPSAANTADSIVNGLSQRAVPFTVIRTSDDALVSKVANTALIGPDYALSVLKRQGIFFREAFDETPTDQGWADASSGATEVLVQGTPGYANVGKYLLRVSGGSYWKIFPRTLPYNPSKLYRIRSRVRCTVDASGGNQNVYIGVLCRTASGTSANNNGGYAYVSIAEAITVSRGWVERTSYFKGAAFPYLSGSPTVSLDPTAPTSLSVDTALISPIIACNYPAGAGTYEFDYVEIDELDENASMSFSGQQALAPSVTQWDGVTSRIITKGHVTGTGRHGATVTFPSNFQNTPLVVMTGGINHEPRAKWGALGDGTEAGAYTTTLPTYNDVVALNLTVSGFTLRARLKQKGTQTARTANADTANNALTSVGATAAATLNNAASGASADYYVVGYKISVTADNTHGGLARTTVVLAIDSSADGGTNWTQRGTVTYESIADTLGASNTQNWNTEYVGVTVSGLSSTAPADKLRIRIVSITKTDGGSCSAHLFSTAATPADPAAALQYNTTSGDQFASKTPDVDDAMKWDALETA